ncbi:hypothetical protein LTR37_009774 [Vermiconidia calcicola]|uniref:Uncharacterized protein n=1 Tax=Vermiconidia calcicola TaxID=1690605 RepID=A0ACC3N793_9PEZI|nr:hypothetical protein LTR37_009774 [Vermiconidia calcicola]
MDSGHQSSYSHQVEKDIPNDIFQPLLMIAQCGYEPRDIKEWYRTVLRHLRRMGPENADAAYNIASPVPTTKTLLPERSENDENTTSGCPEDHVSPMTVPCSWTSSPSYDSSFSFDPSNTGRNRLHVGPTPQPFYDDINEQPYGIQLQLPSSPGHQQVLDFSNDRSRAIAPGSVIASNTAITRQPPLDASRLTPIFEALLCSHESQSSDQWCSPPISSPVSSKLQLQSHYVQPDSTVPRVPYQLEMSNTAMPLLVPSDPPPRQPSYPTGPSGLMGSFSTGLGMPQLANGLYASPYFPMIDVIPSRKRRRILGKGVKKITQSFPLPR